MLKDSHVSLLLFIKDFIYYAYFPVQSISPEQAKRFTKFRERKGLIEKDVVGMKHFLNLKLKFIRCICNLKLPIVFLYFL